MQATQDSLITHAIESYAFVLDGQPGDVKTLGDLAKAIPEVYDLETPQNAAIVAHLEKHPDIQIVCGAHNSWSLKEN